jgi:5'(3')-deoxyribonucleotidase
MKPIIAFDVDSVLFPVNHIAVLPALSDYFGRQVEHEEITAFDYRECFPGEDGEAARAIDALGILRTTYRVIAVSTPFTEHASSKWAYCLRAGFDHSDIVLCGDKTLVDFDLLFDDRADTIEAVGPERGRIFDQPWNRHLPDSYPRVRNWTQVLSAVFGGVLR